MAGDHVLDRDPQRPGASPTRRARARAGPAGAPAGAGPWAGPLRFDRQCATGDDLALLHAHRVHFVGRVDNDATAACWARDAAGALAWGELSPVTWVAELGVGPLSADRRDVVCHRGLVRSTGARHRAGYTGLVTSTPADELDAAAPEPFDEARPRPALANDAAAASSVFEPHPVAWLPWVVPGGQHARQGVGIASSRDPFEHERALTAGGGRTLGVTPAISSAVTGMPEKT